MEKYTLAIAFCSIMVQLTQGYVQCGANVCHGTTAQCCSWDEKECCWLSWYTVWWTWVGAIVFMAILFSMIICCFQNRRRRHNTNRHIVIVRAPSRYAYGAMASYPGNDTYKSTMGPYNQYTYQQQFAQPEQQQPNQFQEKKLIDA